MTDTVSSSNRLKVFVSLLVVAALAASRLSSNAVQQTYFLRGFQQSRQLAGLATPVLANRNNPADGVNSGPTKSSKDIPGLPANANANTLLPVTLIPVNPISPGLPANSNNVLPGLPANSNNVLPGLPVKFTKPAFKGLTPLVALTPKPNPNGPIVVKKPDFSKVVFPP